MAIASLVLGIVSIVLSFFGGLNLIGGIIGIIGIVLGIYGKKDPNRVGMAKAGLICSIVGTSLCFVFYIACVACIANTPFFY